MISDILQDFGIYKKFVKGGSEVYITHYNGNVRISTAGDGKNQVLKEREWEPGI